jgi:protein SCO1/2
MKKLVGKPVFWVLLVGTIFTFPLVRAMTNKLPPPLPVLGQIGDFKMTDQEGQPFGSAELRGRVWVANFIFTRCPTICPLQTEKMYQVQHRSRNLGNAFHIVSFDVDPEYDTPAKLKEYAGKHHVSPRMWSFVTGPFADLQKTVVQDMKVSMGKDENTNIFHGTHVVLVDSQMKIRGYYDVAPEDGVDKLMRDISLLVARGG